MLTTAAELTTDVSFAYHAHVMPEDIVVPGKDNRASKSPSKYTNYDKSTCNLRETEATPRAAFSEPMCYDHLAYSRWGLCRKCVWSVFWERSSRQQAVNVAMAILRADPGNVAREW